MENMNTLVSVLLSLVTLPVVGFLLAATPWLVRPRECFTVTVPADAQADPAIVRLKRGYALALAVPTVLATAVDVALFALGREGAAIAVLVVACCALPVLSFALMLGARRRVRALKEERGWHAEDDRRSAVVVEGDLPRALPLRWELLHLPVVAATLVLGIACYDAMPDVVPMHMDLAGQVDSWSEKSPFLVCFVPLTQLFMFACFVFSHLSMVRSKRPVLPDMPVSSAYAYGMFARAQSVFLVVVGLVTNLAFIGMQLSILGVIGMMAAVAVLGVVALVAIVGSIGLSVVYGQSGARIMARMGDGSGLPQDEDRFWKAGVFYVNRDDPSLFVPERFGIGWTCNFARPSAWALVFGFVALTVGFIVLIAVLV